MIRCLIIDDEPLAIQILEKFVSETAGFTVAGKCRNAIEAFELLKYEMIDLMFLDIEMPLVNGIDLLKTIKTPVKTILTTAFKEYAFEAYELNVVDYLLKPISYDRFLKAVKKFSKQHAEKGKEQVEEKYLLVKDRQGLIKIGYSEILYLEGSKDYVKIVTTTQNHLILKTMKEVLEELGNGFLRVHRSFIVPAEKIKVIKADNILLANDKLIPVGNLYKQELLQWFKKDLNDNSKSE